MVVTDEMIEAGQSALTDQGYDSDMIGEMGLDAVFMAMLDVREPAPPSGSTAGILAATQELKKQPVPTFNDLRVVEDKTLTPMGVAIHVGSEYLRKLKEQGR